MSAIQIADINVDELKNVRMDYQTMEYVEFNPYEEFLSKTSFDKDSKDTLIYHHDNVQEGQVYHRNYLEYLKVCWGKHQIAVVSPDILWYTVLCELTAIVKSTPETYRSLFTESEEKEDITIMSGGTIMPLSMLVDELKTRVPTDTDLFLPEFTTTDERSQHAQYASFCDMCSPYYDYYMLLCGIPAIDVHGEKSDWEKLTGNWRKLSELFSGLNQELQEYFQRVQARFEMILDHGDDSETWQDMFALNKCGSGGQEVLRGWIGELFFEQPSPKYIKNYTSGISRVEYTVLQTNTKYRMFDGLFFSTIKDGSLVPQFGSVVLEVE